MPITACTPVPTTAALMPADRSPSEIKPDASTGGADLGDKIFVARPIEHDDNEVFHFTVEPLRDGFQIVGNRRIQLDSSFTGGTHDYFLHVQIGSVEQAAAIACSEDDDGVGFAGGAKVRSFQWIHGYIDFRVFAAFIADGGAHFFPDEKHGSFVAFAFADDDGPVHAHGIHFRAHGFNGHLIRLVAVPQAHGVRRGDGGALYHAQKFQAECFLHHGS